MQNTTSLELRCECVIPHRSDIIRYLEALFNTTPDQEFPDPQIDQKAQLSEVLREKVLFVTVDFSEPVSKVRPSILRRMKSFFRKDIVAVMKLDKRQITYLLL